MKKIYVFLAMVCLSASVAYAQPGVSINTSGNSADPSAIIDVSSTTQGALIPRMTTAERNAIVNPASGLQIFNTTTECLNIRIGSTWKQICGDCDFNSPIAANNGPICEGSTLNLIATSILGATYSWSGPNGFTSNLQNPSIPNATAAASGSYSVSATLNGCTSQVQSTVATVNATPVTPTAGNNGPACAGSSLNLTATTVVGATYNWTGPNGYSANVQNPVISNAQETNEGTYNVSATVNGCISATGATNVIVNEIPATPGAISGQTAICPNATGKTYTIASVSGASSYNWTVPGGSSITSNSGTSITVTFGPSPTGNITVSATNGCGTSGLSTQFISTELVCSPLTFSYTGGAQSFTIPAGVSNVSIQCWGAQGNTGGLTSTGTGGLGGYATGSLAVTTGQLLTIYVGGQGTTYTGGFNGGGSGGNAGCCWGFGGGGGGASDVRVGGTGLNDRKIVAGGGGGGGGRESSSTDAGVGGSGGGTSGNNGASSSVGSALGGQGGTQSNGGAGGTSPWCNGTDGSSGQGGNGQNCNSYSGGGGGGGYFGGGGGSNGNGGAGGGGGSSYIGGVSGGSTSTGLQTGNGQVIITW